jgi:hypothetical protein
MRKGLWVLAALFIHAAAQAHPVSYQGAVSVMTWHQPYLNDFWTTYSFDRRGAVAARYMRMDMRDGSEMRITLPQADVLLYRRNARHFQSNLYAFGGWGGEKTDGRAGNAWVYGVEADAESRFHYVAAQVQGVSPSRGPDVYSAVLRAGIAAYPAKFEELGTWLIVAYQDNPKLARRRDLTPFVRLMYRNVLWELGAGVSGEVMLNFMVHF